MEPSTAPWPSNMDRSFIDEWELGSLDQLMINQNIWNDIDPLSSESYHPSFITSNTITTTCLPMEYSSPPPPPPKRIESWESSCTVDLKPIPAPHAINLSFGSPDSPSDQSELYETSAAGSVKPFNPRSSTKRSYEEALMVAQGAKSTVATKQPYYNQDHVLAERKRRQKLTQKFIALSAIVPGLKKMDKASVLEDAVKYLKQLEKKVKDLEDLQAAAKRRVESAVLLNKPQLLATDDGNSSCDENFEEDRYSSDDNNLPEIKVRLSEKSVLVRMHCENRKGLLAKALSEIENLHLTVTNTSVVPFGSSLHVTVMAQIEDGFSMTAKDLVKNLNLAIREFI